MNIIMSIKPEWAKKIYTGEKLVEWRKSIPRNFNTEKDIVFLYETKPVSMVTGYIKLNMFFYYDNRYFKHCIKFKDDFTNRLIKAGSVEKKELLQYSKNSPIVAWCINNFYKMPMDNIRYYSRNEKPPQSWCYTNAYFCNGTFNYDHKIYDNGPGTIFFA